MSNASVAGRNRNARTLLADPRQLNRILTMALGKRSSACERLAGSRTFTGPHNAVSREALRTEALACAQLAEFLERTPAGDMLIAAVADAVRGGAA